MGAALELIGFNDTDLPVAFGALANNTGNSNTIRNAPFERKVYLLTLWVNFAVVGETRVRSPKLHDNVQGLRFAVQANVPEPLLDPMFKQILIPQDTLVIEGQAADAATDVNALFLVLFYEDLPGTQARLGMPEFVKSKMVHVVTVENTLATTATGDWGGEEAINAEFDLLKANTDYALVGYQCQEAGGAIRWRGADVGNLGIGGPASIDEVTLTARWFTWLSERSGLPCIPIFNSANRAGVLIDASQDDTGTDITVNSIFCELKP